MAPSTAAAAATAISANDVSADANSASADAKSASTDANTAKEPEQRPDYYYVVSDSNGFVGAFYTASAATAVVNKYRLIPFLVQKFEVAPGPVATVWVVLYRNIDAVAFVSNDRAKAEEIQEVYGKVGLTYEDSIDYWEQTANEVSKHAEERLASISRAHTMYVGPATLEELQARELEDYERVMRLTAPNPDGPIARIIRENEKITILDCVVPTNIGGATLTEGNGMNKDSSDTAADADTAAEEFIVEEPPAVATRTAVV